MCAVFVAQHQEYDAIAGRTWMKREDAQPPSSGFVDVHVDGLWSEDMCACGGRPDERMMEMGAE